MQAMLPKAFPLISCESDIDFACISVPLLQMVIDQGDTPYAARKQLLRRR